MLSWLTEHWRGIAVLGASVAVAAAVTLATGGLGAPLLVSLAAGGFASGALAEALGALLAGETPSAKAVLLQGALGAGLGLATLGLGRLVAPLAARALRAAPPLAALRAGEVLGAGSFKVVHAVEGHPDLALSVIHPSSMADYLAESLQLDKATLLQDEKAMLDELARAGVPTARILEIGTYEGKPAYLQTRFATGDKAPNWQATKGRVLNERSLEDVARIRAALDAKGLLVRDMEVLVGEDGSVVVADPLGVFHEGALPEGISQLHASKIRAGNRARLDAVEREARAAIASRAPSESRGLAGALGAGD